MRYFLLPAALTLISCGLFAQNQRPAISNLIADADWVNQTLTLTYDVEDAENDPLEISLELSNDGGKTYALTGLLPQPVGDIGFPVAPGIARNITVDISALAALQNTFTVRLVADDKQDVDLQELVGLVDSTRIRADLEFVQGIRHRNTGLAHLNAVRDSLRNHFTSLGLPLEEKTFTYLSATGRNIFGTQAGTAEAGKVVIVDAHYDTVNNAPGADDNGSGTVGMMEIARLLSRYPAKKTLRYIGFDMEEDGLRGSINYVSTGIPPSEQIEGVFNFEMIGYYSDQPNTQEVPPGFDLLFPDATSQIVANQYRGDFITNVANTDSAPLGLLFTTAAQQYVPDLKVIPLVVFGNGQIAPDLLRSDHAPFWLSSRPALMITDGADFRNHCYHTPQDTLDGKLNFTFMSNVVKATLAAAAELAGIQHGDWATADFQNTVGTNAPSGCHFGCWYDAPARQLHFTAADCRQSGIAVEILDEKGALCFSGSLDSNWNGQSGSLSVPYLQDGIYFVKALWPGGMNTCKIAVFN
jgi:hypothetical protein